MTVSESPLPADEKRRLVGIVCAISGTILFSLKPVLVKMAYAAGADVDSVMLLRMAFSLPFFALIGIVAVHQRPRSVRFRDVATAVGIGVLFYYGAFYLDLRGLEHISAQLERLILFSYPAMVVMITAFLVRQWVERRILLALALSYAGLLVLFVHDLQFGGEDIILGAALVFAAAVISAVYVVAAKPVITRMGSRLFVCIATLAASVAIFVHVAAGNKLTAVVNVPADAVWIILVMTVTVTVAPAFLVTEAIARLGPSPTSIIGAIGPLATSMVAVAFLGEAFTFYHLGGLGLAVLGATILSRSRAVEPQANRV